MRAIRIIVVFLSSVTFWLVILCAALFIAGYRDELALSPDDLKGSGNVWHLLTFGFAHGSWLHLLVNMLTFLSFGMVLEKIWGRIPMLLLFLLSSVVGGLFAMYMPLDPMPVVGASGGICGLVAMTVLLVPESEIALLFVIVIRASTALIIFSWGSLILAEFNLLPDVLISHWGHIGGLFTGMVVYFLTQTGRKKRRKNNLREARAGSN